MERQTRSSAVVWWSRVVLLAPLVLATASAQQVPLAPGKIPQFVQPLPILKPWAPAAAPTQGVEPLDLAGGPAIELHMCEFESSILPPGTPLAPAANGKTWTWGYMQDACASTRDSYLGPVVVAERGKPTQMTFVNDLGTSEPNKETTTKVLAWKTSTDQTLHWADPLNGGENMCAHHAAMNMGQPPLNDCAKNYEGPIPAVPHLHGGEVPPVLDGGPDAWFTSDGAYQGSGYYTRNPDTDPKNAAVYRYPNSQEPAPIWFHDHALGATRLNVYAGLAGGYVLTDPADTNTIPAVMTPTLPGPADIIPIIIQDRMFDTDGQLLFQAGANGGILWALNPEHPFWNPEFVGDTIVVNGKAWPFLEVEPRRYRFLFLNGSNARTYELFLVNNVTKVVGPNLWVIGTDGGLMDNPALIDSVALKQKLVIMPGERYEVIVDFAGLAPGTSLILKNTAKTPYPGGATPQGTTLGQILKLNVVACANGACNDTSYNPATGNDLRNNGKKMVKLVNFGTGTTVPEVVPTKVRQLTLNEVMGMPPVGSVDPVLALPYPGGPLEILLNNTKWDAATSETPTEGTTEIWEIVNLTADAHPIHLHLVQFQILNRQTFDVGKYGAVYAAAYGNACGGLACDGNGPPLAYDNGSTKQVAGAPNANYKLNGSHPVVGGNPNVNPFLANAVKAPAAQEAGWKDTAMAPPGMVTRLVVRWAPTDTPLGTTGAFPFDPAANGAGYVWHCHIIDHEDNEMMRRTSVKASNSTRSYVLGTDY